MSIDESAYLIEGLAASALVRLSKEYIWVPTPAGHLPAQQRGHVVQFLDAAREESTCDRKRANSARCGGNFVASSRAMALLTLSAVQSGSHHCCAAIELRELAPMCGKANRLSAVRDQLSEPRNLCMPFDSASDLGGVLN
jgi:hypothetical protein